MGAGDNHDVLVGWYDSRIGRNRGRFHDDFHALGEHPKGLGDYTSGVRPRASSTRYLYCS